MPNHVVVSTLGWSKQSLAEALAGIAALEFGQADLALHEGWAHIDPSALAAGGAARVEREVEAIRELIATHGMKRVAACNVGLGSDVADDVAEQRRRLDAVCTLAAALQVPVVTIGAARRGTPLEGEAARLRELVPVAAGHGVALTVETHSNQLTELPDVAVRLCEAVPGLRLTLDASHFHAGPNAGADYSAVFPYVAHVHLRDAGADRAHIQMPAGQGTVDWRALVQGLHGVGYEGKFAIEYIDSIPVATREASGADGTNGARGTVEDIPAEILRMRDVFVALEREAGIVRG